MEKTRTKGFTAKDEFNASTATPIKEATGEILEVEDVMVAEKHDNDEVVVVGYLKTTNGDMYATISDTIINQLLALIEMIDEDGSQKVSVQAKTSNAGRQYFMLQLM